MNPELEQTFVAYTWGPYQNHRTALMERCYVRRGALQDKVSEHIRSRFPVGARIFPNEGRFPGGLFTRLPS